MNNNKKTFPQNFIICGEDNKYRKILVKNIIKKYKKNNYNKILLIKIFNLNNFELNFFNNKKIFKKRVKKIRKEKFNKLKNKYKMIIIETRLQDVVREDDFLIQENSNFCLCFEGDLLGIKRAYGQLVKMKESQLKSKTSLHIVMKIKTNEMIDSLVLRRFFRKNFDIKTIKKLKI